MLKYFESDSDSSECEVSCTDSSQMPSKENFGRGCECASNEKPLKEGYKRIYAKCGAYYDEKILLEGEKRCANCGEGCASDIMITDNMENDRAANVCPKCIESKKVIRCRKCNKFVFKLELGMSGQRRFSMKGKIPKKIYCQNCKPPIIFTFRKKEIPHDPIEIPIPKDLEWGFPWNCFYELLAEKINIPVDKILIYGKKLDSTRRVMMCPIEYRDPEHRTIEYSIEN